MMMGVDDEPMDPLVDPFAAIDNDPLRHYRNGCNNDSSSSSDEDLSSYRIPASLTIIPSSSIGGLKVHRIPAYNNSITITKVEPTKRNAPYVHDTYTLKTNSYQMPLPKKRGRKKGSKNKFRKGVPIELWNQTGLNYSEKNNILKENLEIGLSRLVDTSIKDENKNLNKKYKKKYKSDIIPLNGNSKSKQFPVIEGIPKDSSICLVVEIDPTELFPDDPMPRVKVYRKKKTGKERSFECDICKKGFKCVKGVQTHKSIKHGIEDLSGYYPCEICQEIFALKRDLTYHYVSHKKDNGQYPCPEPGCEAVVPDIRSFIKHKKKIHPYLGTLGRTWFHTWGGG